MIRVAGFTTHDRGVGAPHPNSAPRERVSDPALHPRDLDFQRQVGRDIKVPEGGSSPLAPTRTLVLMVPARFVGRFTHEIGSDERRGELKVATS
jgi:hypothetical protein